MKVLWRYCLLALVAIFFGPGPVAAQEHPRPVLDLPLWIQELIAQPGNEDLNYEDLYESLFQFYHSPLDLNKASAEELAGLLLLTPMQIAQLIRYRQENGPLLSIYELQAVPGLDLATIHKILPFVAVEDAALLTAVQGLGKRMLRNQNQYLLLRWDRVLQARRGYRLQDSSANGQVPAYAGSPHKYQWRYRNSHARDFSLGLLAEKDAGEKFVWEPATHRYGADFYSAHVQVYNRGKWQALALGDYQLQFGQGLLLAGGFLIGKGGETITSLRRSHLGLRPYTSVLEHNFFRGAAFTYALHRQWHLTGFYSSKKVDAAGAGQSDSLEAFPGFSGLQTSGLHRTKTEVANKHRVRERVSGTNLTYRHFQHPLTLGFSLVFTHFDQAASGSHLPYRHFDFVGQRHAAAGLSYSYTWQNVHFFGEAGRSFPGGWGQLHGLLASLSKHMDVAMIYRYYAPDFHAFYGYAFGENTRNRNERGWYTGLKIKPVPQWEVSAYYDLFRFPWLRYRVDAPSRGYDYLVRVLFRPNKQVSLYGQLRGEAKDLNARIPPANLAAVLPARRQLYGVYLLYAANETWQWRARVQLTNYQHVEENLGYYIGQELSYRHKSLRLTSGYALFDAQEFNSRHYVPEADVLYAFAVPLLSGIGSRTFLLLQYDLTRKATLWIKASHNLYRLQKTVGTGLEEIEGPAKTDIRCQFRYRM